MTTPNDDNPAARLDEYDLTPPLRWFTLDHAGKNNGTKGLATGAGNYVVRRYASSCYRDPQSIDYEEQLLAWLTRRDLSFAVPMPRRTRADKLHTDDGQGRLALIPMLRGTPLAQQEHDGTLLGYALGELQAALQGHPVLPRPGRSLFGECFRFPAPHIDPLTLRLADLYLPASSDHDVLLGWWLEEAACLQAFVDGGYQQLPMQLCHNDITPNNILVTDGQVTAVVDFEFATVAARALDFTTGLRLAIRHWVPGEAWTAVRPFCRGYARWATLTESEITALPELLRLRGALTVLWWISSEQSVEKGGRVLDSIANLRRLAFWLEGNTPQLIEMAGEALSP